MKAKIEGENEVRKMYAALGPDSELGYTIIRPGGLTEEEPLGVKVFTDSNPYPNPYPYRFELLPFCYHHHFTPYSDKHLHFHIFLTLIGGRAQPG
jgi:hypothetical protein